MIELEIQIIVRILLSIILSGLIGTEREKLKRPAGIRTHMLVGVGATLVILTSNHMALSFENVQVDRMGAQVISGIGFLGAGTILQQGNTVQGLTTAAGLWAVACIGLAVGSGFYLGAITATVIVLITLVVFRRIESLLIKIEKTFYIEVTLSNKSEGIANVLKLFEEMKVNIRSIEFLEEDEKNSDLITLEMVLRLSDYRLKNDIINKVISEQGVIRVSKKIGGKF